MKESLVKGCGKTEGKVRVKGHVSGPGQARGQISIKSTSCAFAVTADILDKAW